MQTTWKFNERRAAAALGLAVAERGGCQMDCNIIFQRSIIRCLEGILAAWKSYLVDLEVDRGGEDA